MIPMDLVNGRLNAEAHRRLVQSASEGSFTMMRIWGGGIYMPRTYFPLTLVTVNHVADAFAFSPIQEPSTTLVMTSESSCTTT